MAGIYSQGGSAGHRYAGWLEQVEAKNFTFGGKVFNGSPSAIYVGSNLVWISGWLNQAAQQAILGAFGQTDGKAVIKATNAYLNGIAAQGAAGKAKAQALADLLNSSTTIAVNWGTMLLDYQPVEYIEATGSQHINTGVYPTQDTGFYIDFVMKNPVSTSGFGTLIGCRHGWNTTNARCYELTTYNGVPRCSESGGFGFGDALVNAGFVPNTRQQMTCINQKYTNALGVVSQFTESFTVSYVLQIFAMNNAEKGKGQLFNMTLYDKADITAVYYPVYRKSDNVIGLWDIVRGRFDVNAGSGVFLKGQDINIMPSTP